MNPGQLAVVISIFLFFGMAICLEVGYRIGGYVAKKTEAAHEGTSTIQAAVFALLGLLLGFTFANGISHLDQRRVLIVQESNAIGTAYLRLDLLPTSQQPEMRNLFRQYLDTRLGLRKAAQPGGGRGGPATRRETAAGNLVACHRGQPRRFHPECCPAAAAGIE